jgi:hypothetical protein
VFTVYKEAGQMTLKIHSGSLCREAKAIVGPSSDTFDALVFLRSHTQLEACLASYGYMNQKYLSKKIIPRLDPTVAELALLVDGFLGDHEPFASFGFQNLYEQGYITFKRWKSIQHLRLESEINALESGFNKIEEAEKAEKAHRKRRLKFLSEMKKKDVSAPPEDPISDVTYHTWDLHNSVAEWLLPWTSNDELAAAVESLDVQALWRLVRDDRDASRALPIALKARNILVVSWLMDEGADSRYLRVNDCEYKELAQS